MHLVLHMNLNMNSLAIEWVAKKSVFLLKYVLIGMFKNFTVFHPIR